MDQLTVAQIEESQKHIGNVIYQAFKKDVSTLLSITDKNTQHQPQYQLSIEPNVKEVSSLDLQDITISLKNFTDEFKSNIINRFQKYSFYVEKYKRYSDVQNDINASRAYFIEDITERISAYEKLIQDAKDTYPGQFESSAIPFYNEKIAKYINKFQDKINDLHDKYFIEEDGQYVIQDTKISETDIIVYRMLLKNKYMALNDLHILPVVTIPSKSILTSGKHEYGRNATKNGRWTAKWVDRQLKYYKKGRYPVNIHQTRILFGISDKLEYELHGDNMTMLEYLYNHIVNGAPCECTVKTEELRAIYSDLILRVNTTSGGYSGRYNFKRFKKYLKSIQALDRLKFFEFKYMLVDLHTTRKYICNSDHIKFNFVHSENEIESIVVGSLFHKTKYYIGESIDRKGLKVYGIYANGTQEDITERCGLQPSDNLKVSDKYVTISYDNGSNMLTASNKIGITVSALTPTELVATKKDNLNLIEGQQFVVSDVFKDVVVTYDNGGQRSVLNNTKTVYTPASNPYVAGSNWYCTVEYKENQKMVDTSVGQITINAAAPTKMEIITGPKTNVFKPNKTMKNSDTNWDGVTFKMTYEIGPERTMQYVVSYGYPRYDFKFEGDPGHTTINEHTALPDDNKLTFMYLYQRGFEIKTIQVSMPISIAKIDYISILKTSWTDEEISYDDGDLYDKYQSPIYMGFDVKVTYTNNDFDIVPCTDCSISFKSQTGTNPKTLHYGDTYLRLTYSDKSCDLPILVYKASALQISTMYVTAYKEGDDFTRSTCQGMDQNVTLKPILTAMRNNGGSVQTEGSLISYKNSEVDYQYKNKKMSRDDKSVTFTYKGCSVSRPIQVYYNHQVKLYIENYDLNDKTRNDWKISVNGQEYVGKNNFYVTVDTNSYGNYETKVTIPIYWTWPSGKGIDYDQTVTFKSNGETVYYQYHNKATLKVIVGGKDYWRQGDFNISLMTGDSANNTLVITD